MYDGGDELLEEERHVQLAENALVAALAFAVFWANFGLSWWASTRRVSEFAQFTPAQKADWCSRVNSTLHAIVVVVGVAYALAAISWGDDFLPMSSIRSASFIFSIAIGYFLCDLIIIIVWPVAMQWVFIVHHIVAVVPYFINNFLSCCAACQFGLLLFLLVELATLPLNVRGFMDAVGREDSKNYTRSIYATYIIWGVSRTLLPIFLLYSFWAYSFPSDRNHDVCFFPNLVGAHVIAFFCVGVFFFVHTPEILARWRTNESPELAANAPPEDDDANLLAPDVNSTPPAKSKCGSVRALTNSLSRHKETVVHGTTTWSWVSCRAARARLESEPRLQLCRRPLPCR